MKADINVTPLIDVLLVLLIIFMCVAPAAPRALGAGLPQTETAPGSPSRALVLDVGADDIALNSAPVLTFADLDRRLRAAFAARGDGTLFVRAEGDVPYERVVTAIDVAEGAGASRVGLMELGDARFCASAPMRPVLGTGSDLELRHCPLTMSRFKI